MITVVIPYFQRQPGILRKALASVLTQQGCEWPVHVVVVDDASPVPARSEMLGLELPTWMTTRIIEQANGGPGSARNAGLDAAPAGTRYVAFLDSDDEWSSEHLARAVTALEQGFDLYFANLFQLGQTVGAFERAGRIDSSKHPLLPGRHAGLHCYTGDMREQILFGNIIGTPTVVYRLQKFADTRFRVEFRSAGEDYVFWLTLAESNARIAFSSQVEAICGKGVNVYAGAVWGTPEHLIRVRDEIRYRRHILDSFQLNAVQRVRVEQLARNLRTDFAASLLSMVFRRQPMPWKFLRQYFGQDPSALMLLPWVAMRKVFRVG